MREFLYFLACDARRYNIKVSLRLVVRLLVHTPGFSAIILIRLMQCIQKSRFTLLKTIVTYKIRRKLLSNFGIDVGPPINIGPGLKIDHPVGIVIGGGVVIGHSATILSGCVIGERYIDSRSNGNYPIIGDHVTVGSSSIILGGIFIGDLVNIGANSVILKSVPSKTNVNGLVK